MIHIAAGVFLGLIAYTVTMGWWAGRADRRERRRHAREWRRLQRETQRWEQETFRREQTRQRAARKAQRVTREPPDWKGLLTAMAAILVSPAVFVAVLVLASWWHWQQIH